VAFQYVGALVTISAFDMNKLTQFYRQLFQQEPVGARPQSYVEFHVADLRLGIFRPREKCKSEFAAVAKTPMSICLEVDDLDATIDRLKSLGCEPPGEIIDTPHGRGIYAYDPELNRLIVSEPIASK
jgi:predicted enzyme related to lactoylglutathione lyase